MITDNSIIVVTSICLGLATVSVCLKIWTRFKTIAANLRADDWYMIVALILYALLWSCVLVMAILQHQIPILDYTAADRLLLTIEIAEIFFILSSTCFRVSLSVFFKRFLVERWQQQTVQYTTVLYAAMSVLGVFVVVFQCGIPIHLAEKHIQGKCISSKLVKGLLYFHGSFSVATDLMLVFLPMVSLHRSQMRSAEKVTASVLLAMAACSCIMAIIRTVLTDGIIFRVDYLDPSHRPTYYHKLNTAIVSAVTELGLGITAASLACCRPLFRLSASKWRALVSLCDSSTSRDDNIDPEKEPRVRHSSIGPPPTSPRRIGILPAFDDDSLEFETSTNTLPTIVED